MLQGAASQSLRAAFLPTVCELVWMLVEAHHQYLYYGNGVLDCHCPFCPPFSHAYPPPYDLKHQRNGNLILTFEESNSLISGKGHEAFMKSPVAFLKMHS